MKHRDSPTRVSICIATYGRPRGLFALLGALDALIFEAESPEIRVVVVDNDAGGSARPICDDARRWLRYPLTYTIEKRLGIPQARNAAVGCALGETDWIAFVDDDEIPHPRWLETLLSVQRETDADVVAGPAVPRFVEPPPPWVVEGAFFEVLRRSSGEPCETAFTNNALVRESALAELDRLFDERLTLGVGEDTELFERIVQRGGRIVWADDAVVFDQIPRQRVQVGWLAERGLRTGAARTHIDLAHGVRSRSSIVAHGAWCVVRGIFTAIARAHRGRAAQVSGLQLAAYGVGRITGLGGLR